MRELHRTGASRAPLVGRTREREHFARLLDDARRGHGGACVVGGPPGIGKSALLGWGAAHAAGYRVLHVTCTEHDTERAYCALRALIEPLEVALGGLVPEHADALRGVLGHRPATAADGLAAGGALVGLLAHVAEASPVLVAVDDVHWIDPSSRETLAFAAPRLRDEPVVLLFATREAHPDPFRGRVPVLELSGLSGLDAAELLGTSVRTSVAEALALATDGNPLAMLETAAQLSERERCGDAPLPRTLQVSDVLMRGFLARTEHASEAEQRILLLAAADPHVALSELRAAATASGSPPSALADVLERDILAVDARRSVRFTHPLLGHAVYQHASEEERRAAHRVLASVLEESDVDRRAWHLARSVDGPDATAAAELDAAATTARSRSDHLAAGEAFARAADLSSGPARVHRLVEAGIAFADGGAAHRALECLNRALALVDEPEARADIVLARARPLFFEVGPTMLQRDLLGVADELFARDPVRSTLLTAVAALPAFLTGNVDRARELCERALAADPGRGGPASGLASALVVIARVVGGDTSDAAASLVEQANALTTVQLGDAAIGYADLLANALVWIGEFSTASRLVSTMVDAARRRAALSMLAFALVVRSDLYYRSGHWHAALADATEAEDLSREIPMAPLGYTLVLRGRIEASTGDLRAARDHTEAGLRAATQLGTGSIVYGARGALGFTELVSGRLRSAAEHLEACRAFATANGIRLVTTIPWAPDLVEAYVRSDRVDDAVALVDALERDGAGSQPPVARALFERCRGLVAERSCDEHFYAALGDHATARVPFEQARTELCYGERLRRQRRARDAREHLERAAAAFETLGARPWLDRAHQELGIRTAVPLDRAGVERLTPQQFRVAVAVGNGATNREAAAALFLSPRTVEQHLLRVYQALGIRSRAELVKLVATDPEFARDVDV